jgi:hypothetical protein
VLSAAGEQGAEPPLQPRGVVLLTSATLPAVALMLIGVGSVTSGAGSAAPVAPPAPCTSRRPPGARLPVSSVIWELVPPKLPVPVALAYCSDQPVSETELEPRLKSSTKSLLYGAPLFPPPP